MRPDGDGLGKCFRRGKTLQISHETWSQKVFHGAFQGEPRNSRRT